MKVEILADKYEKVFSHRDRRLFTKFLVTGYKATTLNTVSEELFESVVYAKVCLGMLITLYDDLADNPKYFNPELLKTLYQFNIGQRPHTSTEHQVEALASELFDEMELALSHFPHFSKLKDILVFDIKQIFIANQYSELMTMNPHLRNMTESRIYGPYNMGMVAAGMIDLMASTDFDLKYLGDMREVLIKGQRMGRIGNVISTYKREQMENDLTNEMLLHPEGVQSYQKVLENELILGLEELDAKGRFHQSSLISTYTAGLRSLYQLHTNMEGII